MLARELLSMANYTTEEIQEPARSDVFLIWNMIMNLIAVVLISLVYMASPARTLLKRLKPMKTLTPLFYGTNLDTM